MKPLPALGSAALLALTFAALLFADAAMPAHATNVSPVEHVNRSRILTTRPLEWMGPGEPDPGQTAALSEALSNVETNHWPESLAAMDDFIAECPQSPWTPSVRSQLAYAYYRTGRYTLALDHWEAAWQATKDYPSGPGKRVADFSLAYWTHLLAGLGRYQTLTNIIAQNSTRQLDRGFLSQFWNHTREAVAWMHASPGIAYRCGTLALFNAASALQLQRQARPLLKVASPASGFSLQALSEMSARFGLGFVPVKRDSGQELVVPSVIHWQQHHYAAIVARWRDGYRIVDPTFGNERIMTAADINAEASGYFLVPANKPPPVGYRQLSTAEAAPVYGQGYEVAFFDDHDFPTCANGGPPNDSPPGQDGPNGSAPIAYNAASAGGCSSCGQSGNPNNPKNPNNPNNPNPHLPTCCGMPVWRISEPYLNMWLDDEPIGYQPAVGPRVSLAMHYKQRYGTDLMQFGALGPNWFGSWFSAVDAYNYFRYSYFDQFELYSGFGADLQYNGCAAVGTNYYTTLKLWAQTNSTGVMTNIALLYPSGAIDNYSLMPNTNAGAHFVYLSQKISPEGYTMSFQYDTNDLNNIKLTNIVDACGGSTTLTYITNNTPNSGILVELSQVTDPFGRSAYFFYDPNWGYLTNVVDVAGITNTITYDSSGVITNLTTPYGQTKFLWGDASVGSAGDYIDEARTNTINQPDGGVQMYAFLDTAPSFEATTYSSSEVPTNDPFNTLDTSPSELFSYHWDTRQYSELSTNNLQYMSNSDYLRARMRHWLGLGQYGAVNIDTLSFERDPSPDGTTFGQMTWYDYLDKPSPSAQGSSILPDYIGRVLPDGSTWSKFTQRNTWLLPTNTVTSYSLPGGAVGLRTNSMVYASNHQDLLQVYGPDGALLESYGYNPNHQLTGFTNAVGDWMTNGYNSTHLLVVSRSLTGLTTTNTYFTSGGSVNWLQQTVDLETKRTNSFTYANDLVATKTDERGLITTNLYDALQRLTNSSDSRGAISYFYSNLDLIKIMDREGFTARYLYDSMRRRIAETNALGYSTFYSYCTCGALNSIQDALGNLTSFSYDSAGRLLSTAYPDGFGVTNNYNLLSQITNTVDTAGSRVTNWFDNQGLLVGVSNAFGVVLSRGYDIYDRLTNSIDANSVSITNTYDYLGRVLTRSYPDGGLEKFGYAAAGPIAYTNQITNVTYYAYDPAGRKTFETNANVELTQFQYSPAADLTNLIDGKLQNTKWNFDQYGRVTNKVDNAGNVIFTYGYDLDDRLTNRWTPAKGTTTYSYDPVGNLTNVTYPVNSTLVLGYDALNRLTSMLDGLGWTYYTYDAAGQMLSERGPWSDDTVNYAYTNRLRSSLSVVQPNGDPWAVGYGYDSAKRLSSVVSPAGTFSYAYPAGVQGVVGKITLPNSAYITNSYDTVARMLTTRLLTSGGSVLDSQGYRYDLAGERLWETNVNRDYRNYAYDRIGQLMGADAYESNSTARLQEQLGYEYDAAHNLNWRTNNGFWEQFAVNNLNELSTVSRSTTNLTVAGTTTSAATNVTVNGSTANLYADTTFALGGFSLLNGNNTFTAIAQDALNRKDTNSITVNLPSSASYSYDFNGNLLGDGTRSFAYDDENELTSAWVTNVWRSDSVYDGKMRRRIRREYTWSSGAWLQTNEVHYIYDGNLAVQERDVNNLPLNDYVRGRDPSGSFQGAGGIGGLLALSQSPVVNPQHYFYHADGNGNVTMLINTLASVVAKYSYDPFGNALLADGPLASANLYRFSSKELNLNSGLYYFGYRFYDSSLQRWPNRDPIGEQGHRNLRRACMTCYSALRNDINSYEFCDNSPILENDSSGLMTKQDCQDAYDKAMEAAKQAGLRCLGHAAGEGIIGGICWGLGGVVVGGVVGFCIGPEGAVPGMAVGAAAGEVANVCIDMHHLHKCQQKVKQMEQAAQQAHDDCLKHASDQ